MVKETDEELKDLKKIVKSETTYYDLSKILERGLHAYNQAVGELTDEELDGIKEILGCIANQWDDKLSDDIKEASMKKMRKDVEKIGKSKRKALIKEIFDSVSRLPDDGRSWLWYPPHVIKSPRSYP